MRSRRLNTFSSDLAAKEWIPSLTKKKCHTLVRGTELFLSQSHAGWTTARIDLVSVILDANDKPVFYSYWPNFLG